ncbi:MAG: IS1595 family transposase [Ginsengibacter sp.]
MESQFKNLQQLLDFFKDDATCKEYYEKKRWGGNVACPHCGSLKIYRTNRGFKCGEKLCAKKFSVTVGTIFENTKISLRIWFAAMYLISTSKKGVSSLQLAEQLGITQKTAWFLNHRIREMLKDNDKQKLSGVVAVDETFVGGKNKNRHADKKAPQSQGRAHVDKTPVVGLIQINGKVRTFVVANTDAQTLHTIMGENVEEGSILVTDSYRSYNGLDARFTHIKVKHETNGGYVVKIGNEKFHTNNIENFWSIFKRGIIGIYHFVSVKHLERYCQELGYRYNNRECSGVEKFESALLKVSNTRITYNKLIGKN